MAYARVITLAIPGQSLDRRSARDRGTAGRPMKGKPEALMGIGALSRAAGVSVETLRTWERRYGFPAPTRAASGHRLYRVSCVPRLRRISDALSRGIRARQAVAASDEDLAAMLDAYGHRGEPPAAAIAAVPVGTTELLAAVRSFDASALGRALLAAWGRLGPLAFVRQCVAPLVTATGLAWATGELGIRHEHFLSERLGDLLRMLRQPFDERGAGPLVLLTTLPGELHVIGLQMAALVAAAAGCRVMLLGPETPIAEIAALARDTGARAVGVSVSSATAGTGTARRVERLRRALPAPVVLLVGGDGAPRARSRVVKITDLDELDGWARAAAHQLA